MKGSLFIIKIIKCGSHRNAIKLKFGPLPMMIKIGRYNPILQTYMCEFMPSLDVLYKRYKKSLKNLIGIMKINPYLYIHCFFSSCHGYSLSNIENFHLSKKFLLCELLTYFETIELDRQISHTVKH